MFAPIFEICAADPDVQTNLGTNPVRLYPFNEAPQDTEKPYCVWQRTGGSPENYLGGVPDIDDHIIQCDVYADTASQARDAAKALQDAIEPYAHITAYIPEDRDPDTNNYRFGFILNWWVDRDSVS